MNPSRKIYNFTSIMSRRKQSNPKPLLKSKKITNTQVFKFRLIV